MNTLYSIHLFFPTENYVAFKVLMIWITMFLFIFWSGYRPLWGQIKGFTYWTLKNWTSKYRTPNDRTPKDPTPNDPTPKDRTSNDRTPNGTQRRSFSAFGHSVFGHSTFSLSAFSSWIWATNIIICLAKHAVSRSGSEVNLKVSEKNYFGSTTFFSSWIYYSLQVFTYAAGFECNYKQQPASIFSS